MLQAGSIIATMGLDRTGFRRGIADTRRDISGMRGYMREQFRGMATEVGDVLNNRLTQALSLGGLWLGLNRAWQASDKLEASQRTLAATAKITGQNLGFLQVTARDANNDFSLGQRLASDFTIELSKLAGKAGDIQSTGLALGRALDLGAARGLDAEQTLQAVRQAILGIDEGTDKLFGANPSVLYDRFAVSIGTTAARLTDAQKAQAILTALMEDGGKVAGQYGEFLKSPAGEALRLRIEQEEAAAAIGRSMNSIRQVAFPIFRQMTEYAVKFVGGIQLLGAEFPVYVARFKLWIGELDDAWGGGLERIAGKIQSFYEWGRELPEWVQWVFGFKLGDATIGNVADFVAGTAETGVDRLRAELRWAEEAYAETAAQIIADMANSAAIVGDTNPLANIVPPGTGASAEEELKAAREAIRKTTAEIRELGAAKKLGVWNVDDFGRIFDLHDELNRKLAAGNLTLEQRVALAEQIRDLGDLMPKVGLARPNRPSAPDLDLTPEVFAPDAMERMAEMFGLLRTEGAAFAEEIRSGIGAAFYGLGNTIEDVFSAMVDGTRSASDAFKGGMLGALASVARGFAGFFLARAAGAVGEAILNPLTAGKNLAAAAKLTAAAMAMYAVAGLAGGGARSAGDRYGGDFAGAGSRNSSAVVAAGIPKTELHVWVDPVSASNPRHQGVIFETAAAGADRRGVDLYVNGEKASA